MFKQLYGTATLKLVNFLQEFFQVQQFEMGVVDNPTAELFNQFLDQFNGLSIEKPEEYPFKIKDDMKSEKNYTITGKVMLVNDKPGEKITVIAFNKNLRSETELGRIETSASGLFTISYEPVFRKSEFKTADIFFRLNDGEKELRDIIVLKVTSTGKNVLPDGILFNATASVEVEIKLFGQPPTSKVLSEFEDIGRLIIPLLEETNIEALNENEEHKDFSFLFHETGLDKNKIICFALSHRLLTQSGIDAEFWYALTSGSFYQDVTKSLTDHNLDTNFPKIITALFTVTLTSVNETVKQAFEADLIPSKLESRLPKWVKQFSAFITKRIANMEREEHPPYVKSLMNSAGLTKEKQEKFLSIYLNHGSFDEAFWKQVEKEKRLGENETKKLLFAHSLTKLEGNNERLVSLAAALPRITNMRELALKHNTESLSKLLTPEMLPDDVEGKTTKSKLKNYASTIQRQLFATETSAVLQRMATNKELPIKDDQISKGVANFFDNQSEFNIRTTSIYNAIKSENAFKGIAEKHREEVVSHLKTLQRVQAISPANETVVTLMKANISTAHRVTEMSESSFMTAFSKKMGEGVARQVYTNATNLKLRNEQALISMKEHVEGTGISLIDGNGTMVDRKVAFDTKAAENNIPLNWETLFGNVDLCECGECTSVYSPAAYFVELLQYLRNNDLDPKATGVQAIKPDPKDISDTVLEKLFRRRPDLGCLELTCANTNTILPYVDLVNEVMESFIVHLAGYMKSKLNPKQATIDAWNVEDETTGELLAQPQHINDNAYLELKKAVYPFTLPYDRPVDMIRIFLRYLDTSRYELMKTFRAVEQNVISKDVMPEDTKLPVSPSPDPDEDKIPAFNKILSDRALDAEFLSITQEEYIILTKEAYLTKDYFNLRSPGITEGQYKAQIGVKDVPEYYGYTGSNGKSDMLSTDETLQIGLTFVKKQFLKRTGLVYIDLVELLKTEALNPMYPKGKALLILESIPFSYRFLQGLEDKTSLDPPIRFKKLIDALEYPQNYIPGYDEMNEFNPCKPQDRTRPAFRSANIKQWVFCYFERIGKMIILENNAPDCDCVEGQFFRRDGSDYIQIVDTEGQLFLTKDCDLVLKRRDFQAKVGHIDSMSGFVSLKDKNGDPVKVSVLTNQEVIFKGNNGEIGVITLERLINRRTDRPFSCKQPNTDTCDLNLVRLKHLDGTDLSVNEYDKMHRFIRLWRKMGWSIDETDKSLVALTADKTTYTRGFEDACDPEVDPNGFAEITPDFIHQLVAIKKLLDSTGLELIKLLAFWTTISTVGEKSLYKRLFLTHNLLAIDDIFKADNNGNYLSGTQKIVDHISVLMAAFNLKYEEIDALVSVSNPLTIQSVSMLYRKAVLAKLLHVKTADIKEIIALFTADPFQNADKALEFFEKWDKMESSGFTFTQLNYLINDSDNLLKPIKPSKNTIIRLAKTIYDGLIGIDNSHPDLPVLDGLTIKLIKDLKGKDRKDFLKKIATEELVRSKVSLLFDQKSAESVMGLLQGTIVYSAAVPIPATPIKTVDEFNKKFPNTTAAEKKATAFLLKKIKYDFTNNNVQVTGILTTKEQTICKSLFPKPGWKAAFDIIRDQAVYIFDDLLVDIFAKDIPGATAILLDGDVKDLDNADNDTAPAKREYFLEKFFPYLRKKLTEKFLIDTLSGATWLDSSAADILMSDILAGISTKKIMEIFKDAKLPPTSPKGWKGYLIPAAEESYELAVNEKTTAPTFSLQIDGVIKVDENTVPAKDFFSSGPLKLKAGQFYLFEVSGLTSDLIDISWSTAISPKSSLPQQVLLPMSAIDAVEEGFIKLFKAAIVVNNFSLTANEISWLQNHNLDFDKLDFNTITLQHLLRIEAYMRLRDSLPASDITLVDFFAWTYTAAASTIPSEKIGLLTGRKKEDIDVLIDPLHFNLITPKDFSSEINLLKLLNALFVYDKINLKLDLLFEWAKPVSQFNVCLHIAETIRKSIQARYKQDDWEHVVKPLNDQLREHQKQALINYLLVQTDLIAWGVVDADSLFEFFLIDVQMDACMQTSRLKQAISSVQLFVQRCFLGEEANRGIPNDILDRDRWRWMQRNPLWVANRKVFLWPENWTLTSLRDDKSAFFKELESDLWQKDINKQNVIDACKTYLYKVDEVTNMEVIGLHIEMEVDVNGKETKAPLKLHVFARTRNAPYFFYYRYFHMKEANWYAWEKMQVDIPTYEVGNVPLRIGVSSAQFISGQPGMVAFDGLISSYPSYLSNFKGRFGVDPTMGLSSFYPSPGGTDTLDVEIPIEKLNGTAVGRITGINANTIWFAGIFEGVLVRKDNTNGCFLIPAVWNGRLLVFFPQIMKKTKPSNEKKITTIKNGDGNTEVPVSKPIEYYDITMCWTEYRNGKWTQKQLSKDSLPTHPIDTRKQIEYFKFVPIVTNTGIFIIVDDNLDPVDDTGYHGAFTFDGNTIKLGGSGSIDNMPINYFNKIEPFFKEVGSKIFSWQISDSKRANTSIYFENAAAKEMVRGVAPASNFYHPYTHDYLSKINLGQIDELFDYNLSIPDKDDAFGANGVKNYHELKRPYSLYNWEFFFHIPVSIARELSATQQFEEAMKYYHYVFDPTAKGTDPKRFWQFLPFKEINTENFLENFFNGLQPNAPVKEINEWRSNPFQPHLIARSRPSAYMKWVVMEYIENLIAWGDYLFKQDTIETVNYATQLYILASHIVPSFQTIPKRGKIKPETYNSLLDKWDAFGNAMVELELVAPFSNQIPLSLGMVGSNGKVATANIFGFATSLYFCIPNNPKLKAYRDTIADRLYKIRHCENIEGVFRMLPLWDPPIDPALLVAATAQGLSLDSVLNDLNTPLPNYRCNYLLQKAIDLCNEVKSLGNSLLSVLEKKDGEALAVMRAGHETAMHNLVMEVKKMQVEEANAALEGLEQNRRTTEYRLRHYLQLVGEDVNKVPSEDGSFSELSNQLPIPIDEGGLKLIKEEKEEMDKAAQALGWQIGASGVEVLSSVLHIYPDIVSSVMPFGVGVQAIVGGTNLGFASSAAAKVLQTISSIYSYESTSAQRKAGFRRQLQDRILQANLAGYECKQIDKQIISQRIRINISNQEITNQQKMIDNTAEAEEFLKSKYTNEELYKWMEGQVKTLYRQVYDLAYDWAKKAEQVFRFDRGLTSSNFIQYGYWDASRNGLLAGEKLFLGLKQLEAAYHENRGHDFEVTKHISLQQLNPLALLELRENGKCEFEIPEVLFDMDFSGHYMRRIKSVALSIPCIAGPYTSVNATLRLQEHNYRLSPIATNAKDYPRKTDENDDRFTTAHIPIASIATSSGQNDSGVFELNFKDERYMPFEGAGVISKWRLELPDKFRQFKYETISDIIIIIRYTSKDGGDKLKKPAADALIKYIESVKELSQREGLFAMFDLKHDFANEWYKAMQQPVGITGHVMQLGNLLHRLPVFTKTFNQSKIKARDIYIATSSSVKSSDFTLSNELVTLDAFGEKIKINDTTNVFHLSDQDETMDNWSLKFTATIDKPDKMWLIVRYTLE